MIDINLSVKYLIRKDCANYDKQSNKTKDYCCLEKTQECRCIFFLEESARCKYFEESVLPCDKQIEALYWADKKAKAAGYELSKLQKRNIVSQSKIKCCRCNQSLNGTKQKYCENCQKLIAREKARTRKNQSKKAI